MVTQLNSSVAAIWGAADMFGLHAVSMQVQGLVVSTVACHASPEAIIRLIQPSSIVEEEEWQPDNDRTKRTEQPNH